MHDPDKNISRALLESYTEDKVRILARFDSVENDERSGERKTHAAIECVVKSTFFPYSQWNLGESN